MSIEDELNVFVQLGDDLAKGGSKRTTVLEHSEKQPRKGKGKPGSTKVKPDRPLKGIKAKPTPNKLTGGKGKIGKSVDESESESSEDDTESPVTKSENLCKCGATLQKGEKSCSKCMCKSVGGGLTQFVDELHGLSDADIARMISKGVPQVVFNSGEEQ